MGFSKNWFYLIFCLVGARTTFVIILKTLGISPYLSYLTLLTAYLLNNIKPNRSSTIVEPISKP